MRSTPRVAILIFLLSTPIFSSATQLKPETLKAWNAYIQAKDARMQERAHGQCPFLWIDEKPDLSQRVRAGEVLVDPGNGDSPHTVPHGLIHDWVGAMFVPNATLDDVAGVLNAYQRYKDVYKPMVVQSKLLEQTADREKVSLRMMQKAYSVTAAVETDDDVLIARPNADREYSLSTSVSVREIADYGEATEHELPQDNGPGYVWRTLTVTRLEQRDGGVYVEMDMIALSRSIPLLLRWLVQPLAERLPREILTAMLQDTREAVSQERSRKVENTATESRSLTPQ